MPVSLDDAATQAEDAAAEESHVAAHRERLSVPARCRGGDAADRRAGQAAGPDRRGAGAAEQPGAHRVAQGCRLRRDGRGVEDAAGVGGRAPAEAAENESAPGGRRRASSLRRGRARRDHRRPGLRLRASRFPRRARADAVRPHLGPGRHRPSRAPSRHAVRVRIGDHRHAHERRVARRTPRRTAGDRARAAIAAGRRIARHTRREHRRGQPRRLPARRHRRRADLAARSRSRQAPRRSTTRAGSWTRSTISCELAGEAADLDQHQPRHQRPLARRQRRGHALDRRAPRGRRPRDDGRRRQLRSGARRTRRRLRLDDGTHPLERADRGRRARAPPRVARRRQRAMDVSENEMEIWFGAPGSDRRLREAARRRLDRPGRAAPVHREPDAAGRLDAEHLQRGVSPGERPQSHQHVPEPVLRPGRDHRRQRRDLDRPAARTRDSRRPVSRLDRARRPAQARPRRHQRGVALSVVLHRSVAGRRFDGELPRVCQPHDLRRQLRRRPQPHQPSSSEGPTRDGRPKPDVAAPGTASWPPTGSPDPIEPWIALSGTSMASPFVAGVAGLMLAVAPD